MINPDCKHESLSVKVTYQRHYVIRIEKSLVTSASLDAEKEVCESATCTRCGYQPFVASAGPRDMKAPKFTKAIVDFERQVKQIVDLDAFVNELREVPYDAGEEEEWQK